MAADRVRGLRTGRSSQDATCRHRSQQVVSRSNTCSAGTISSPSARCTSTGLVAHGVSWTGSVFVFFRAPSSTARRASASSGFWHFGPRHSNLHGNGRDSEEHERAGRFSGRLEPRHPPPHPTPPSCPSPDAGAFNSTAPTPASPSGGSPAPCPARSNCRARCRSRVSVIR